MTRRIDREQYIDNFVSTVRGYMQQENIEVDIYGRPSTSIVFGEK